MIERVWAIEFASLWIDAFNSHDLNRIFELYEDDFEMKSIYIIDKMNVESGVLNGKREVQPYWEKALEPGSTLEFKLIDVFIGVDSVVLYYESIGRNMVCETFTFSGRGKIKSGCSQHGESYPSQHLK